MAKLVDLNWPHDTMTMSMLTSLTLSALEELVEFIPDEKLREASERLDQIASEAAKSNQNSAAAVEGAEIARSAFGQIVRR